jgi:hypothetical protein
MADEKQPKYSKVTISGPPGVGTSTLKNSLVSALAQDSWRGYSGGEHMRAHAIKLGYIQPDGHGQKHHSVAAYPPDFDREVDMAMRQRIKEENFARWAAMYEPEWKEWVVEGGLVKPEDKIDFFHPGIYHLAIDTVIHNQESSVLRVLGALGYKNQGDSAP